MEDLVVVKFRRFAVRRAALPSCTSAIFSWWQLPLSQRLKSPDRVLRSFSGVAHSHRHLLHPCHHLHCRHLHQQSFRRSTFYASRVTLTQRTIETFRDSTLEPLGFNWCSEAPPPPQHFETKEFCSSPFILFVCFF